MDSVFQWIQCYSGFSVTVDSVLQWIQFYSGFSVTVDSGDSDVSGARRFRVSGDVVF